MKKNLKDPKQRNLIPYFIFTYLLFWSLLGLTGFLISKDIPELLQTIIKNVCSWTPTFIILLMFKRLYPNTSLREYFRNNFLSKTKFRYYIIVFLLQAAIFAGAILSYLALNNLKLESISLISVSSLIPILLIVATSGSMGEELGWRAYALNTYQKKYSPIKSALIVGLVWAFWHLPLWIFSGYSGLDLLIYCFFFLVAVLSLSVFITYFYNKGRNVLIAMWMHFLFNFFIQLVIMDLLQLLAYLSLAYLLSALVLFITSKHAFLGSRKEITNSL